MITDLIARVAAQCNTQPTFDMLAEEVLELHLSLRGKHDDRPEMEWLEIAVCALRALSQYPEGYIIRAVEEWESRHATN